MANFSQDQKKAIAPKIKEICKKYGIKGSLGVRNHSTVVLNIKSGDIDFIGNHNETVAPRQSLRGEDIIERDYLDVNVYWYQEHFTGKALDCLKELIEVLNTGNYDKSDAMTDYFNVGFYVDVNIGTWDKPYILNK